MRHKRIKNLIVGGALICALFITKASAYDQMHTHPALTDEMVDFYNLNFPQKLSEQDKSWIIKGSMDEDQGMRPMNHFYDPIHNIGIAGFSTSKQWAMSSGAQSNFAMSNNSIAQSAGVIKSADDFSYERAIDDYASGDRQRAMVGFGHLLHLLEDAGVPDHTRNDPHPPVGTLGSPYEHEMAKWNPDNFNITPELRKAGLKPVALANLGEYFDKIAKYSNGNFFSRDTINNDVYNSPNVNNIKNLIVNRKEGFFIVGKDRNGEEFPLAFLKLEKNGNSLMVKEVSLVDPGVGTFILDGYWDRLSKEVVLNGAGALNLFLTEAEKAKTEYANKQLPAKPNWFSRILGLIGVSVGNEVVDNSNDGDSMVTLDSTSSPLPLVATPKVTNPSVSPKPLVTKTPDTNVTILTPSVSPSKTPVPVISKTPTPTPNQNIILINNTTSGGGGSNTTVSPTPTPSIIPSPSITPSPTPTPTPSPSVSVSPAPTPSTTPTPSPIPDASGKININTANLDELDKITGVGPAIAQKIIDFRNANGPFKKIEDIIDVNGIGDKTFEKMKDEITVGDIVFKPSTVTDLIAGHHSPTITATWSAPDSGGFDIASLSYDLRYSDVNFSDTNTWDTATKVASSSLPKVDKEGAPQSASFNVVYEYGQTLYFALKTGLSDISNIAEVSFPIAINANSWAMIGKDQYHTSFADNLAGPGVGATISWEFDAGALNNVSQPVVSANGDVIFGASDGTLVNSKLYSIRKEGENIVENWHYDTNVSIGMPAVLADGTVYLGRIGAGGYLALTALNSDGSKKWDYDDASRIRQVTVSEKGEPHFTYQSGALDKLTVLKPDGSVKTMISGIGLSNFSPIVLENGTIIVPSYVSGNQFFTAYSAEGIQLWQQFYTHTNGNIPSNLSHDRITGKTYSSAGPKLFDISLDGSVLNSHQVAIQGIASTLVAISNDSLYAGFDYSWINPASGSKLFSLNKSDLNENWSFSVDSRINQQIAIDKEENVYFSTENGKLYCLTKTGELMWVIDVATTTYISPVLTKDGLTWGYGSRLTSIEVK